MFASRGLSFWGPVALLTGAGIFAIRKWAYGPAAPKVDLKGKVAIVTGANTGIGYESAKTFLENGATVVLACRDEKRGLEAEKRLREQTGSDKVGYQRCRESESLRQ